MMKSIKTIFAVICVLTAFAIPSFAGGTAKLQIIHNAADPAAEMVDLWVNGEPFKTDFAFRTATPFLDVPAGVELNVGVAPAGSQSTDDIIATFPVTLKRGRAYVAIANGVLDPSQFDASANAEKIAFNVYPETVRSNSWWSSRVRVQAFHGATDAPTVDVRSRDSRWPLFNNLGYGEFSHARSLKPKEYVLEVTPGNDPHTVVAAYTVDLNGLGGGAAVVFASGFLNPSANQDGAAFGLFAALADGTVVEFPAAPMVERFARLQIIHNAADPAAEMVDIWVNGEPFKTDFAFRTATPFMDVPAEVELNIGVAPAGSQSTDDIIASFPVKLKENRSYVAIANGVLGNDFESNPDGESISFSIFTKDRVLEKARWGHTVSVLAFHGATDAPSVDVIRRNKYGWTYKFFNDLTYGEFSRYRTLLPKQYTLEVTPANDNNTVVAKFDVDLSGLGGGAAVVFASGFLSPDNDNDGPAFGLFAALPNGTVVEFPQIVEQQFAKLQVIHNAADPAAEMVDIWVNGAKFKEDFAFRTATAFDDVPAGVELNIGVAGADSDDPSDIIATFPVTLEPNKNYVAIANGVLGSGFEANPDGREIGFTLFTTDQARLGAEMSGMVDFFVLHGATDAPAVDVFARGVAQLVNDAAYGDITDYITVPAGAYTLDITPGADTSTIVASFTADLSGLGGGAAVVFASGFLSPDNDNDGPAFGLFAALPNGTVVEFPQIVEQQFAKLQVIHNAADPAAEMVDIWVNGAKFKEDFAFRTATAFDDVPAGVELNIGVAGADSDDPSDIIATFPVTLEPNKNYVAIANGVLGSGFEANPDGREIGFTLFTTDQARLGAEMSGMVDFFVLHGATDAPAVDVFARGVAQLVNDAAYGDITDYITVPAGAYTLDITPGADTSTIVASFAADLSGLGGGAAVVFASGFLSPDNDNDGPAFGLFAALPNGTVVAFPAADEGKLQASAALGGNDLLPREFALNQNYPNPFNPTTVISFALPNPSDVRLTVFNLLGQEVETLVDRSMEAGEHQIEFDASALASGVYFYRLSAESFTDTRKMLLVK